MRIRICNITFYSHPVIHLNKQIIEFVYSNIRNYSADYLIFILILFIAVDRFTGMVNLGEIVQIFGIDSFSEVVENDPFADKSTETTNYTTAETTIETSIIANTLETN